MALLRLFRAVQAEELQSIKISGCFSVLFGIETKYFATSMSGAIRFARQAHSAYADGPYHIIETAIESTLLSDDFRVTVDGGIETVVLSAAMLIELHPPIIKQKVR